MSSMCFLYRLRITAGSFPSQPLVGGRRLSRPQSTIHQSDSLIPFSFPLWSIVQTYCKLYISINSSFALYSQMCVNSRKRKVLRYIQFDLLCRDIRVSQVLAHFST